MSGEFRAFVNERPVMVPAGATAQAAIGALDPALAVRVAAGEAYVTDGRGIRLAADLPLAAGAILRVVISSKGTPDADA